MRRRTAVRTNGVALLAGALAVGCTVGGASDGPAPAGRTSHGHGVSRYEAWVACSRYIAVGDVTAVHAATTDGRVVVSLTGLEWLKPSHGEAAAEWEVVDPATLRSPPLRPGEHVLLVVADEKSQNRTYRDGELTGARRAIERALPTAPTACPSHWSMRPDA